MRRCCGRLTAVRILCLIWFCFVPLVSTADTNTEDADSAVSAQQSLQKPEAWLVTFGPGRIYWERFGHNAIWLKDPAHGLNHTFNFGFFDFGQKDFFLRFLRGRMLYFSVAQPAEREFEFYRGDNRSIRAQKLDLDPTQYERLRDYLLNEIKEENRDYRYDYYLNNCSTRIRDALDLAYDGALSNQSLNKPAGMNFRDQTRRLTQMQFWHYFGLELALGYPVDRPVSRWEEMFVPMVVAEEISVLPLPGGRTGQSVVLEDKQLYTSNLTVPEKPDGVWYRYLLLGLVITGLAWLSGKVMPEVWRAGLAQAWILIGATNGLILAALWGFTDHAVAALNVNLLLFNPLILLALVPVFRRIGAILLIGGIVLCCLFLLLPEHQYNIDVLALLAPINLLVALYLIKSAARPAS
jgi:hypothetical protein